MFDMIHSDIIGPLPTPSYGNSRFVLTFIDDFSRCCWVYFLKQKYEVFDTFKDFKSLFENLSGNKIKVLRKDYVKNDLQKLCEENGNQMQHSIP